MACFTPANNAYCLPNVNASLDTGIMARMVQTSVPTMSRAFIGWAIFLPTTVFECLGPKPLPGLVQAYLPQEFYDAGHGETEALGDATKF